MTRVGRPQAAATSSQNAQVSRTLARSAPPTSRSADAASNRGLDQADVDLFEIIDTMEPKGVLSQAEFDRFRAGYCDRPDPTRGNLFKLVGQTGKGVITPAEFRQFFVAADIDGNGFISRSKYAHYEQVVAPILAPPEPERPWECPQTSATHAPANSEVLALVEGLLEGFREAAESAHAKPASPLRGAAAPSFGGRPGSKASPRAT